VSQPPSLAPTLTVVDVPGAAAHSLRPARRGRLQVVGARQLAYTLARFTLCPGLPAVAKQTSRLPALQSNCRVRQGAGGMRRVAEVHGAERQQLAPAGRARARACGR